MKFLKLFVVVTCLGALGTLSTGCKKEEAPAPAKDAKEAVDGAAAGAKAGADAVKEAAEDE